MKKLCILAVLIGFISFCTRDYFCGPPAKCPETAGLTIVTDKKTIQAEIRNAIKVIADYLVACADEDKKHLFTPDVQKEFKNYQYSIYGTADVVIYKNRCTGTGFEVCNPRNWPCVDFIVIFNIDEEPIVFALTHSMFEQTKQEK